MKIFDIFKFSNNEYRPGRVGLRTRSGDALNLGCTVRSTSGNLVEARLLPGQLRSEKIDPESPCVLMMEDGSVVRASISSIPSDKKIWLEITKNESPPRHRGVYRSGISIGIKTWMNDEEEPIGFEQLEVSLSGEGVRFPSVNPMDAQTRFNVALKLPDHHLARPISAEARVVRCDKTSPGLWTITARYETLSIRDYEEIVGFIIDENKKSNY